jgi:hypothetical protein
MICYDVYKQGSPIKFLINSLCFVLAASKSCTVAEMCGSRWEAGGGGVGVEEASVGVGGGVIRGVSDFTSLCDFAGWVL